jgi:tetratricopeptide (TPR) repeat protein
LGRDGEAASVYAVTDGNPLLTRAILGRDRSDDQFLPPTVRDYFLSEVGKLGNTAQLLGAALAAIGEPATVEDLSWLVDGTPEIINAGLENLLASEFAVLDQEDGLIRLRHDTVAEAFLVSLAPAATARMYGRAARLLQEQGRPAALVATQFAVAGDLQETFSYAIRAGEASARLFAYREAEHFYRIATASADNPTDEMKSRVSLSQIYLSQGRHRDAHGILDGFSATRDLNKADQAFFEAHLLMARLAEIGPPSVTETAFERALALEDTLPTVLSARLYTEIAASAQQGLFDIGTRASDRAVRLIESLEDGPDRFKQEVAVASVRAISSQVPPSLERLDELTSKSRKWPDTHVTCLAAAGAVHVSQGMPVEATDRLVQALELSERLGFVDHQLRVLNNLGVCYLEQGEWDEAHAQFALVARSAGKFAPKEVTSALANITIIEFERGNYEEAIALSRENVGFVPLQTRMRLGSLAICGLAQLNLGWLAKARHSEREIRVHPEVDTGWSNDVSYLEIFLARMGLIDGRRDEVVCRLERKVREFRPRDFYCASRMEVEALRILSQDEPERALPRAEELRPRLAEARARPLVERVDRIITRCRSRAAE